MKSKVWTCAICQAKDYREHTLREMMFGFRDVFSYAECLACGCIQIMDEPANLDKYYPPYYYSFNRPVPPLKRIPVIKRLLGNLRMKRVYRKTTNPDLRLFAEADISMHAKILDVGCGNGELICRLFNKGFEHVQGVDKFIPQEIDHGFGVKVLRSDLHDLPAASYDLLMMHHVLEHISDQLGDLQACFRLLKTGGCLLVRIPVKNEAWNIYGKDWVQLDPPRHFFIHTEQSLRRLAGKAGFTVQKVVYDATAFQFLGSELYRKDIPLHIPETHAPFPVKNALTDEEISRFEERTKELNAANKGDQAAFYLYKS